METYSPTKDDLHMGYPVTVDFKKLSALIITGFAVSRRATPDRMDLWNRLQTILYAQAEESNKARASIGGTLKEGYVTILPYKPEVSDREIEG